ncbi:MAG: hypothetical protein LDL56_01720 [Armatimonadetes bacterium]|nr:hypothetical protein [Armatimonadota bacterium]
MVGRHPHTILRMARRGDIPAVRLSARTVRFEADVLSRLSPRRARRGR